MKAKQRCQVEPGREIYLNGKPFISVGREGDVLPHTVDRLTRRIAAWLNEKGCFMVKPYPKDEEFFRLSGGRTYGRRRKRSSR